MLRRLVGSELCIRDSDYVALEWLFKLYAIDDPASVLEAIQVMEAEAVKILNESGV